jgi:LysM repeat protein
MRATTTTTGSPRRALARGGAVRLTARGRTLFLGAVLSGSLVGGMTLSAGSSIAAGEAPAPREFTYVIVQPGQTLWEIARTAAPTADPRRTIARILDLNALPSSDVQAGQRIALP